MAGLALVYLSTIFIWGVLLVLAAALFVALAHPIAEAVRKTNKGHPGLGLPVMINAGMKPGFSCLNRIADYADSED